MPFPERDTPEWIEGINKVGQRIMRAVSFAVFIHGDFLSQVFVLIRDETTGGVFGACVAAQPINENIVIYLITSMGILNSEVTPKKIANNIAKDFPDVPLIVDKKIAEILSTESVTWYENGNFKLLGMNNGTINVYTIP